MARVVVLPFVVNSLWFICAPLSQEVTDLPGGAEIPDHKRCRNQRSFALVSQVEVAHDGAVILYSTALRATTPRSASMLCTRVESGNNSGSEIRARDVSRQNVS
jgi:hypothetical protein